MMVQWFHLKGEFLKSSTQRSSEKPNSDCALNVRQRCDPEQSEGSYHATDAVAYTSLPGVCCRSNEC